MFERLRYSYSSGRLSTLTLPSGQVVTYSYNSNNQIAGITVGATTVLSSIQYDPLGPAKGWTWGNGTLMSRTYDQDGKLTQLDSAGVKTQGYDDAFRITSITDALVGANNWTYNYDSLDRLTGATKAVGTVRGWTYDANGNRLTETGSAPSSYTISATNNRVTSTTGALARTYGYNSAGNTLSYATVTSTYNNRGRLASLTKTGSTRSYVYNALGQMARAAGGTGGTVLYMYDEAGHVVGEYGAAGSLIQETIWLGDTPVATLRPNGAGVDVFYVHVDHLNTPRKITQPSDNATRWRWDSDPFGTELPDENPSALGAFAYNLRFPGQIYDPHAGLHQNYFRDYDPAIGKYVESDPIGLTGGVNSYGFVGSQPTSLADPQGLDAIQINYDYYPVNTGLGFHLPLGHGAVVAVDPATGITQYYEFGRYTDKECGNVRRRPVPNVVMGSDGKPTKQSLAALYAFVGKHYGEGSNVTATYYDTTNYKDAIKYAQNFAKQHACYRLVGNNCKTFAHDAATAPPSPQE